MQLIITPWFVKTEVEWICNIIVFNEMRLSLLKNAQTHTRPPTIVLGRL